MEGNMSTKDFARTLGMTEDELMSRLRADGYVIGNTQTKKARRMRVLHVTQGAGRGKILLHKGGHLTIWIPPKGQLYFTNLYGRSA